MGGGVAVKTGCEGQEGKCHRKKHNRQNNARVPCGSLVLTLVTSRGGGFAHLLQLWNYL